MVRPELANCYGALFTSGDVHFRSDGSVEWFTSGGGSSSGTVPGAVSGNQSGVLAINVNAGVFSITTNGNVTGIDLSGITAMVAGSADVDPDGTPSNIIAGGWNRPHDNGQCRRQRRALWHLDLERRPRCNVGEGECRRDGRRHRDLGPRRGRGPQ